jgi:hypothetical protein
MRLAAFAVTDGERSVEITAIALPASGGDRLANVNRWRDQVGLVPLSVEELPAALKPIEIDGRPGDYVEIVGQKPEDENELVLGAIVDHNQSTWFFKLKGDVELARREEPAFQEFIHSVRFRTRAPTAFGESQ